MKTITVKNKNGDSAEVTIYDKSFSAREILMREVKIVNYLRAAGFKDTEEATSTALKIAKVYATVEMVCQEIDIGNFPGLERVSILSPTEKAVNILEVLPLEEALKIWKAYFDQFEEKNMDVEVEKAKNF